jgi:hypothetical protein
LRADPSPARMRSSQPCSRVVWNDGSAMRSGFRRLVFPPDQGRSAAVRAHACRVALEDRHRKFYNANPPESYRGFPPRRKMPEPTALDRRPRSRPSLPGEAEPDPRTGQINMSRRGRGRVFDAPDPDVAGAESSMPRTGPRGFAKLSRDITFCAKSGHPVLRRIRTPGFAREVGWDKLTRPQDTREDTRCHVRSPYRSVRRSWLDTTTARTRPPSRPRCSCPCVPYRTWCSDSASGPTPWPRTTGPDRPPLTRCGRTSSSVAATTRPGGPN